MRRFRNEDGATAVLVSILLVVIFSVAAVAVDLGSAWETKRELVADTDAAALAAAIDLEPGGAAACLDAADDDPGTGNSAAYAQAEDTLFANRDTTDTNDASYQMIDFDVTCSGATAGRVTVASQRDATTVFAGVMGFGNTTPANSSTAQWGELSSVSGSLRPFGACYIPGDPANSDPHVAAWVTAYAATGGDPMSSPAYAALKPLSMAGVTNPYVDYPNPDGSAPTTDYPAVDQPDTYNSVNYASYGVIHRIYFNNNEPVDGCGSESGGWGMICFNKDDGHCDDIGIRGLLDVGWDGTVDLGGSGEGDEDCYTGGTDTDDCDSHTGQFPGNSEGTILQRLIAEEEEFPILLFDSATDGGPGSNAVYDPSGFLGVVIRGYGPANPINGNFGGAQSDRFLDLEFVTLTTQGGIGPPGAGGGTGVRGVALCGADGSLECS